jgi:hypothetical protein
VILQRVEALDSQRRPDRQQADAVPAGQPRTRRRGDRGHRQRDTAVGVRGELQLGIVQLVRRGLSRHRLPPQQPDNDVEVGVQQLAGVGGGQADHRRVAG